MQRLIVGLGISLRSHHAPCVFKHVRVAFAVQGQKGGKWVVLDKIEHNPGYRRVGTVLAPGSSTEVLWAWWNWCDKSITRFRGWARIANRVVTGPPSSSSPYCAGPGARSALTPSYGY
jgi:hypothetical protein